MQVQESLYLLPSNYCLSRGLVPHDDTQLQLGMPYHPEHTEFDIDVEHARRYDSVTFRGKKCYSTTLPETVDTSGSLRIPNQLASSKQSMEK